MSNIIPIVSSSPPPYEDSQSFGWDEDDDDDFGNFASAPSFQQPANSWSEGAFDVDWSQAGSDTSLPDSSSKSGSPAKEIVPQSDVQEKQWVDDNDSDDTTCVRNGGGDEFANFAALQDDKHIKPYVGSLPLHDANQDISQTEGNCSNPVELEGESICSLNHTAIERSRESTTDSGLFSSDLSPLPKSDSTSDCDRIVHSEDETFADLPQDTPGDSRSSPVRVDGETSIVRREEGGVNSSDDTSSQDPYLEQDSGSTELLQQEASCLYEECAETEDQVVAEERESGTDGPGEDSPQWNSPQQGDEDWADFETHEDQKHQSENHPENVDLKMGNSDLEQCEEETDECSDISIQLQDVRDAECAGSSLGEPDIMDRSAQPASDSRVKETTCLQKDGESGAGDVETTLNKSSDDKEDIVGDSSSHIPAAIEATAVRDSGSSASDDEFGDFSGRSASPGENAEVLTTEGIGCSDVNRKANVSDVPSAEPVPFTSNVISSEKGREDDEEDIPHENSPPSHFNAFSSDKNRGETGSDNDDFGDFSSQDVSDSTAAKASSGDGFGAFSGNGNEEDDDFGDFSGQGVKDSGSSDWAAFSDHEKNGTASDDFGNFSEQKLEPQHQLTSASVPAAQHPRMVQGSKLENALSSCFPASCLSSSPASGEQLGLERDRSEAENKKMSGTLGTILQFGLGYRAASQQTWQVVEHPSKKDPGVKLWHHLQDVDGSPAIMYQWLKSHSNSQLFTTLHIDTQNMLIGHKKPSVPIFATGLSLLEPIRGGGRERGERGPAGKDAVPNLVDPNQSEADRPTQDIPAVDFDWSTSGLTNPLTSKSLDLDFLVVQENESSEKLSDEWDWVFESELLDAPRSNVKPLQPLEDILKSVKPTSVRNRHDDTPASQMSQEASRVLAGLPDLTFMQSKVLMFPIRN